MFFASPQRPAAPDSRPVILAFGDSLTAGYGVPKGSGYPEQLQRKLDGRGYKYRVVSMGLPGDTTSAGRARMKEALAVKPAVVILELGANDGLRGLPVKQMQANLEEMIAAFRRNGAAVILAGMTLPRNYGASYVRPFERAFEDVAAKYKLPFIPFFLAGVAGSPTHTLDDLLHPNAKGYAIVTETVLKTLEPLLKKSRSD
ncbi:MAG: arylesterase [Acidobacteria bacterium]|nr:arylesterase [Acidobacteriota bacterium]